MFGLGMQEMIIVMVVAVLLFGKRLPEVARSLGASYNQFRRGLQDIQSEFDGARNAYYSPTTSHSDRRSTFDDEDYDEPTAPRFEPPEEPEERSEDEAAVPDLGPAAQQPEGSKERAAGS